MSHTQHTPGPWEVSYRDLSVQIYGANGSGIGEVYGWSAGSQAVQQEAFANAHLIAAAPAMLAALRAMVGVTINSGHVSDDMAPALEMALAVIKQATGDGE